MKTFQEFHIADHQLLMLGWIKFSKSKITYLLQVLLGTKLIAIFSSRSLADIVMRHFQFSSFASQQTSLSGNEGEFIKSKSVISKKIYYDMLIYLFSVSAGFLII